MSSLIRRLSIRMMKRGGYTREKWIIVKGKPVSVKRDGEITDPDDTPIGRDWPPFVPARCMTAPKGVNRNFIPLALRRSKRSQQWLEARAKARGEAASDPLLKEVRR